MVNYASVEDEYKKNVSLIKSDVVNLLEWCDRQPHLPKITELEAMLFLHSCFFSNEAAKECIDCYFTCHTHFPEFFANCDPLSPEMQTILNTALICILPKRTPQGDSILYYRLINTDPQFYSYSLIVKEFHLLATLHLREHGCSPGYVVVLDAEGSQLMHLFKTGVQSVKRFLFYMQNALPVRLKEIHFVNGVSFMDKALALVKPFLKKELADHLYVHYGSNEGIFTDIPKECLPKECGGDFQTLFETFAIQRENIEKNAKFFADEETKCVDESKRSGTSRINMEQLGGIDGTFKKIDFD